MPIQNPSKLSQTSHSIRHVQDLERMRKDDPYMAGTLVKGLLILQIFVTDPRPHANSEFARQLGLPRSTVSRLCRTLHTLGFLDHDERLDRYFVGPAAVSLGYPYLIHTPMLTVLRPAMQALADQVQGAVSIGVAVNLDVIYVETCAYEAGTLMRPGVGAVRGVLETAMGRAWLAQLPLHERREFMERARQERPQEYARCMAGLDESLAHHVRRGFAINLGDTGMGVSAVGVQSRIKYGPRPLIMNCAVPGIRFRKSDLIHTVGPRLLELVRFADRQSGTRQA